jgi:hypothetical protein
MQKNSYNNFFFLHCNFWLNHMLSLPINLWIYHTRRADTWLPQKFHWNNFRGGYGHPYYTNDWAWLSDWANCWPAWSSYVTIYDHSPFIFMVVHLSLNWTSNCSAHGCPSKRQPFLSLVTRSPFCSDTARLGLGFFARHLSTAMPAMQLCYGSMDATIETRLGAHSTTA